MLTFAQKNQWVIFRIILFLAFFWPINPLLLAGEGTGTASKTPHHFTLLVEPSGAKVEILNLKAPYQPNMLLKPGRYQISVSAPDHETEKGFIDVTDQDWIGKVVLRPINAPTARKEDLDETSTARLEEEWKKLKQERETLEKARLVLSQEQERLDLAKKDLDTTRQVVEKTKQEQETLEKARLALSQEQEKLDLAKKDLDTAREALETTKLERNALEKARFSLSQEQEKLDLDKKELDKAKKALETTKLEKNNLEKARLTLSQEQEKLDLDKKELDKAKRAMETTKQEWEAKKISPPSLADHGPVAETKPVADKPTAESKRALPVPTPAPQIAARSKVMEAPTQTVAEAPTVHEAAPLPPTTTTGSETAPPPTGEPNGDQETIKQAENATAPLQQGMTNRTTAAATTETTPGEATETAPAAPPDQTPSKATPSKEQTAALLANGMRYLQQARAPQSGPPPEGKEALRQLRQAQQADPANKSIAQALQLYAKRYVIYTGLFEHKEKADEMVQHIQALGIPAFQQPMVVKGKPANRVCIGLFLTQAEAHATLQHLQASMEVKAPILRIYKQ